MSSEESGNGKTKLDEPVEAPKPVQEVPQEILQALAQTMSNNPEDITKFSILHHMSELDRLGFFTEFTDFDQVLRMNKIEIWIQLIPQVFGNSNSTKKSLEPFVKHVQQHKLNMTSYKRKRELAIVHALRNDPTGAVSSTNEAVKKFIGAKRT